MAGRLIDSAGVTVFEGTAVGIGGSQPIFVPLVFTEVAGAMLYTATVVLPSHSRVLDVLMETTVWASPNPLQNLGDDDGPASLIGPDNDIDNELAFQSGKALGGTAWGDAAGFGGPYSNSYTGRLYPSGTTITGTISVASPSNSPTGVCRMTLIVQVEATVTNAVASGP